MAYNIPIYLGNETSSKVWQSITSKKRHSALARDLRAQLMTMPIEELKALTLEKAPNGCASELANEAYKILWKRKTYYGE